MGTRRRNVTAVAQDVHHVRRLCSASSEAPQRQARKGVQMKMLWFVVVLIGSALKELAIAPFVRTPKIQGMGLRTQNIYLLTLLFLFELIALPIVNVLDALYESFHTEI